LLGAGANTATEAGAAASEEKKDDPEGASEAAEGKYDFDDEYESGAG
jgi:hypothetical protein